MRRTKKKTSELGKTLITMQISTGIGAGVVARSPSAAPMMAGFSSMAGMMSPVTTGVMGGEVLRHLRKYPSYKKKRVRRKKR